MKKRIKWLVAGMTFFLIVMLSISGFASGVKKSIEVIFNSVIIKVNGTNVKCSNILYEGNVYVRADQLSDGHDLKVISDTKNKTISFVNNQSTFTPAPQNKDFNRIEKPPVDISKDTGIEHPAKYYKVGNLIYILNAWIDADVGTGSEVWIYNTMTKKYIKLFTKYEYVYMKENEYYPSGDISSISNVDLDGNVYFNETWGTSNTLSDGCQYVFIKKENVIITLSNNRKPKVFTKEMVEEFNNISEIIRKYKGAADFDSYVNNILYSVKYNLQDESGNYYHEIGGFAINSGFYIPLIRVKLSKKANVPFIFVDSDKANNLEISGLSVGKLKFVYDSINNTYIFPSEIKTNDEYQIVKR